MPYIIWLLSTALEIKSRTTSLTRSNLSTIYLRLGVGRHHIALQRLQDKFGGKRGISSKNKQEADRIIRERLKGSQQIFQQPHMQMQPFPPIVPMVMPFLMGSFGLPQPQYPQFHQQDHQFPNQTRGNGPCFNCNQTGHVARYCPVN